MTQDSDDEDSLFSSPGGDTWEDAWEGSSSSSSSTTNSSLSSFPSSGSLTSSTSFSSSSFPPPPSTIIREGWMFKKKGNEKRGGWKKRYFILTPGKLSYYKNSGGGGERWGLTLGVCVLKDVRLGSDKEGRKAFCFEMVHTPSGKKHLLRCATLFEKMCWMHDLFNEVSYIVNIYLETIIFFFFFFFFFWIFFLEIFWIKILTTNLLPRSHQLSTLMTMNSTLMRKMKSLTPPQITLSLNNNMNNRNNTTYNTI